MARPAWPAAVNHAPLQGSWKIAQKAAQPLESDMNSGATRRRNKFTLRIALVSFVLVMRADEVAAFDAFWRDVLGNGAARFDMPVWDGAAFVTRACAFHSVPSYEQHGAFQQRVTLALKVESL